MGIPRLARVLLDFTVVTLIILFLPGLPPRVNFESYELAPVLELKGPLAPNNVLSKAEAIFQDEITGPESIVTRGDEIYAGLIGGEVVRFKNGQVKRVAKFGQECEHKWEEEICGRPLGIRFDKAGKLIVVDSYYGLFRVDVDTGSTETLVSAKIPIQGKLPMCPNDLDVAQDGTIYWSDSTTSSEHLQNTLIEFLGEPTGRFLKYDPKTKESTVLLEGLHFANGVQLSKDEDFVLIAETFRFRVIKYHLKGAKKGQKEIFIDGLPGSPDNIRSDGKGGILVNLIVHRTPLVGVLSRMHLVRKFILRFTCLFHSFFSFIHSIFPNEYSGKLKYYINHLEPVLMFLPKGTMIIHLDESGRVLRSLQSDGSKVNHISQITVDEKREFAYMGSPYNKNIWKIKVQDLGI